MPSRVATYLQENGASLCLRFLEGIVSTLCTLLLLCGVVAASFSAVFIWDGAQLSAKQSTSYVAASGSITLGQLDWTEQWYMYALGGIGLGTSLAAMLGLWAVGRRSIWLLNLHIVLLSLVLATELCAVGAAVSSHPNPTPAGLAFTHGFTKTIHSSATFRLLSADSKVEAHVQHSYGAVHINRQLLLTVLGSVGLGLQIFNLMFSCLLQSSYSQVDEAAQDAAEEASERRPLLPRQRGRPPRNRASAAPEDPDTVQWRTRMQERYGIDTRLLADAQAARNELPPELGPSRAQQSACTIM